MKKKDVLLVLVVILIPIVLLGALAIMGADNIKPSVSFEGEEGAYTVYEYELNEDNERINEVNVTNGADVRTHTEFMFYVEVNEGYTGVPILSLNNEILSADAVDDSKYFYSVLVDKEPLTITISGLTQSS